MKIKGLVDEDFVQYKKPSMFIIAPYCTFKCDKEAGCNVCQNSDLAAAPIIEIEPEEIVERFNNNPITEAIVFGGLEPFDGENGEKGRVSPFHIFSGYIPDLNCGTDIVIYTGYYPSEIHYSNLQFYGSMVNKIKGNLIIKFGRFIPNRPSRFDKVLGIELASNNQFAVNLSTVKCETAEELWKILVTIEQFYRNFFAEDIKYLEEKLE